MPALETLSFDPIDLMLAEKLLTLYASTTHDLHNLTLNYWQINNPVPALSIVCSKKLHISRLHFVNFSAQSKEVFQDLRHMLSYWIDAGMEVTDFSSDRKVALTTARSGLNVLQVPLQSSPPGYLYDFPVGSVIFVFAMGHPDDPADSLWSFMKGLWEFGSVEDYMEVRARDQLAYLMVLKRVQYE